MISHRNHYTSLRQDLSGSLSKNRYRYELLWGISKIYDLFLSKNGFLVIFDYASDIDVIQDDDFHFYQLKTRETNLTLSYISRLSKSKESILSKLVSLDTSDSVKSLNIVSNFKFKCNKNNLTNSDGFCFNQLDQIEINDLNNHLNSIKLNNPDFSKYFFIRSDICINRPNKILIGETTTFLKKILNVRLLDPEYFLNYLISLVLEKATYEKTISNFNEIAEFKGISNNDLKKLIDDYKSAFNPYMELILDKADILAKEGVSYPEIIKIKQSLNNFRKIGFDTAIVTKEIKKIEDFIINDYCNNNSYNLTQYIEYLMLNCNLNNVFDEFDKKAITMIAITNIESWSSNE